MKSLLQRAARYQLYVARKSDSYYAAARYYRRLHTAIGGTAAAVGAMVGTAVFASVLRGDQPLLGKISEAGKLTIAIVILVLALLAPVLSSLHTFLRFAENAEQCRSSASKYDVLRQHLVIFALRYSENDTADRSEALAELETIISDVGRLAESSPAIPDRFWDRTKSVRIDDDTPPTNSAAA